MKRHAILGTTLLAVALAACEAPLDVEPRASVPSEEALTDAAAVAAAANGLYNSLQGDDAFGRNLVVYPDLYADNLRFTGTFTTDQQVGLRTITPNNGSIAGLWTTAYGGINDANEVLAAIPQVSDLTEANAARYRGEALFVRALHYFNLVRLFGGVPIITEPSRTAADAAARAVPRSTQAEVYALIERDLEEAARLLPTGRVVGRASQMTAHALLARVYLEDGKYALARDKANTVINSGLYRLVTRYSDLYEIKNSVESILELQYTIQDSNAHAFWFFPNRGGLGGRWGYAPTSAASASVLTPLLAAFETGDTRRTATIGGPVSGRYYGRKYFRIENGDDNVILLRLAEMYLIRAEANARLNADPAVVRADIDIVRQRAGLPPLPATLTAQADLLSAILRERRVELALEGHRFFDLRRFGQAQQVLGLTADRLLFPIPQRELDVNPRLDQNPGY